MVWVKAAQGSHGTSLVLRAQPPSILLIMQTWRVAPQPQCQLQLAGRAKTLPFPLIVSLEVRTPFLLAEAENMITWSHTGAWELGKCDIYSVGGRVPPDQGAS